MNEGLEKGVHQQASDQHLVLTVIKKKKPSHFSETTSSGQKVYSEKIQEATSLFLPLPRALSAHCQDVLSVSTSVLGTLLPSSYWTLVLRTECSHSDNVPLPQLATARSRSFASDRAEGDPILLRKALASFLIRTLAADSWVISGTCPWP